LPFGSSIALAVGVEHATDLTGEQAAAAFDYIGQTTSGDERSSSKSDQIRACWLTKRTAFGDHSLTISAVVKNDRRVGLLLPPDLVTAAYRFSLGGRMRKPEAFLSLAASCALLLGACSSDSQPNNSLIGNPDGGAPTTQTDSAVVAASDAGLAPSTPVDAGQVVAPKDAGTVTVTDSAVASDGSSGDGGGDGAVSSNDPEFDSCLAQIKPLCVAKEMNTAALMEVPCKSLQTLALPLTNGMTLPPATLQAGPYAGKIDWNEGAGTPFVTMKNLTSDVAEFGCLNGGIEIFAEPKATTDELKNTRDLDYTLFTVFRPACMKKGEKYPVITWANGTCGLIHGYSALLSTVASHGFVIIASNSTWTNTAPTDTVQLKALDYAKALNEDSKSPLYQRLDLEHIGAEGHSQGAAATKVADIDPRIDAVIFWNSQVSNNKPHLNVSAERDTTARTPADMMASAQGATKPGAWIYFHKIPETGGNATGHLTLMEQPERVVDMAIAWWKWQLKGDEEAKKMFVGDSCGLCTKKDEYEFGHNMLMK
jgi:hypothetical protein